MYQELYPYLDEHLAGGDVQLEFERVNKIDKQIKWINGKNAYIQEDFKGDTYQPLEEMQKEFRSQMKYCLGLMNRKLAPNNRYERFINHISYPGLELATYIAYFPLNDELYKEMNKYFVKMFACMDTIVLKSLEEIPQFATKQDFIQIIYYLKILDIMKKLKTEKSKVLNKEQKNLLSQTFIYRAIMSQRTNSIPFSKILKQINYDIQKYGIVIGNNINLQKQMVSVEDALMKSWETLYFMDFEAGLKLRIYEEIKDRIKQRNFQF